MTVSNLEIAGRRFVVLPQKDFERLTHDSAKLHLLMKEDAALGKLAEKELRAFRKHGGKGMPWEQVKLELGL